MGMERAWVQKANWHEMGVNAHKKMMATLDLQPEKTVLKCLIDWFYYQFRGKNSIEDTLYNDVKTGDLWPDINSRNTSLF